MEFIADYQSSDSASSSSSSSSSDDDASAAGGGLGKDDKVDAGIAISSITTSPTPTTTTTIITQKEYQHPPLAVNGFMYTGGDGNASGHDYDADRSNSNSSSRSSSSSSSSSESSGCETEEIPESRDENSQDLLEEEEEDSDVLPSAPPPPPLQAPSNTRMESRLGLTFPVARMTRHLRAATGRSRISAGSGIAMTAAMESLTEYMLQKSEEELPIGPKTNLRKRSKMIPRDLQMTRKDNKNMTDILRGTTIGYGGVLPRMPASLLGKRKRRSRRRRPSPKKKSAKATTRKNKKKKK